MTAHSTRFGLSLVFQSSLAQTVKEAKRAADVGFDVVLVPDHLGLLAPFPTLVAITDAVPSIRREHRRTTPRLCHPATRLSRAGR